MILHRRGERLGHRLRPARFACLGLERVEDRLLDALDQHLALLLRDLLHALPRAVLEVRLGPRRPHAERFAPVHRAIPLQLPRHARGRTFQSRSHRRHAAWNKRDPSALGQRPRPIRDSRRAQSTHLSSSECALGACDTPRWAACLGPAPGAAQPHQRQSVGWKGLSVPRAGANVCHSDQPQLSLATSSHQTLPNLVIWGGGVYPPPPGVEKTGAVGCVAGFWSII